MGAEKSIEQRVKDIIVEQLGVNADQVTPEAKFIEDLGADSLAEEGREKQDPGLSARPQHPVWPCGRCISMTAGTRHNNRGLGLNTAESPGLTRHRVSGSFCERAQDFQT